MGAGEASALDHTMGVATIDTVIPAQAAEAR
jgi:hypothetical protein